MMKINKDNFESNTMHVISVLSRIEHSSGAGTYISQNLALLEWVQSVTKWI